MFDRRPIATAPRDGTFVRLFFEPGLGCELFDGTIGQWREYRDMPASGAWFTRDSGYITSGSAELICAPRPIEWAPIVELEIVGGEAVTGCRSG